EIDLPFGDIRARLGGGLAGHNGLKSLKAKLGSPDFHRVRIGVGRPDSTDPEIVAAHVLGKWRQSAAEVSDLVRAAADAAENVIAVDASADMLAAARERVGEERVTFLQADLALLVLEEPADAILSTATFHWIGDQAALYRALHGALRPGGRLVAQCGGEGNI